MGSAILNSERERAGTNGDRHSLARPEEIDLGSDQARQETPTPAGLRARSAGNNLNHPVKPNGKETEAAGLPALSETKIDLEAPMVDDLKRLQAENADLHERVAELEQLCTEASKKAQHWADQSKDHERLLEEKSDVIRELHVKIQQLQTQSQSSGKAPSDDELLALEEELERERRQLKEDEETLMKQMRDMEVQISRERAELARQRNDLQRLHGEIRHELELAGRETELRQRLQPLQRRYQEMTHRKGAEPQRGL